MLQVSVFYQRLFFRAIKKMRTFIYLGLLSIATAFIPQDASKREIPAMLAGSMPIRREPEFSTSDSKPLKKRASPYLNPKTESTTEIYSQGALR